jgi:hypothetical protein
MELGNESKDLAAERFILSLNPILYLPLWCNDGATFISHDRYGHSFTKNNGAVWNFNGVYEDGIDDSIDSTVVLDNGNKVASLLTGLSRATVCAWVNIKSTTTSDQYFVRTVTSTGTYRFGLVFTNSTNTLAVWCRSNAESTAVSLGGIVGAFTFGNWHFCVGKVDMISSTGSVLLDNIGKDAALSGLTTTSFQNNIGPTSVGPNTANRMKGTIGEVHMFPKWLTPQETTHLYELTKWRNR